MNGSNDHYDEDNKGHFDRTIANDDDDEQYRTACKIIDGGIDCDDTSEFYTEYEMDGPGPGPGILLSILEDAVYQLCNNDNDEALNHATTKLLRDDLEPTWKSIRTNWLWAFDTLEERSVAAYARGTDELAPLHLVCKLTNNPPSDILREILRAAPEVAGWPDAHTWLPLHHACNRGASTEVLKLLIEVCPESKLGLDVHNRTPLHLYATRGHSDHYNPQTMATNFGLLCSVAAREDDCDASSATRIRDVSGMIPMHYACAYGTSTSVLAVLEEAYPESIVARDDHGRTPLHFVMVNSQRSASPAVLSFLLSRKASINVRDHDGNLPLHLLTIAGTDLRHHPEHLENLSECLQLYLGAEPHASTDFLAALQALPEALQDVAVVSPHVRNILNQKIIQRIPTAILVSRWCAREVKTIQHTLK